MPKLSNVAEHFEPKPGLVRFLFDDSQLRYKVHFRLPAARRPVIGRYRTRGPDDLADGVPGFKYMWQARAQSDHVECEFLCAILQFVTHTKVQLT